MRALCVLILFSVAAQIAQAANDQDRGWHVRGSPTAPPFVLVVAFADKAEDRGYFFDCSQKAQVKITQTGVTKLPPGEPPLMSLSIDDVPPNLVVASSIPNPAGGMDLTISIAKTDKAFVGLPKAKLMSLFSTGHTIGVFLEDKDRPVIGGFVQQCLALDAG
jgi:hypothetical protein